MSDSYTVSSVTYSTTNNTTTSGSTTNTTEITTTDSENSTLIAKATALGIDVSDYEIYDAITGEKSIDMQKLSVAIQEATKEKIKNINNDEDSFVRTTDGRTYTREAAHEEAKSEEHTINSEYVNNVGYYNAIDTDAAINSTEGQLAADWSKIISLKNDLTSSIASNTTILEGAKEFINSLTNLVKETKKYTNSDEFDSEDETETDELSTDNIFADDNNIVTYASVELGNNPFYNSALNTFGYEEEETEEAV